MSNKQQQEREAVFVNILTKLEEYFSLKAQLGDQLKQGHFQLAQAKYAAAPGSIGQASYSGHLDPLISVTSSYNDDSDSLYPRFIANEATAASSSKHVSSKEHSSAQAEACDHQSTKAEDSGEIHNDCSPPDQGAEETSSAHKSKRGATLQPQQALLKMFGYLTPPTLRQAQASFSAQVPAILQLANLHQELLELVDQYDELAQA